MFEGIVHSKGITCDFAMLSIEGFGFYHISFSHYFGKIEPKSFFPVQSEFKITGSLHLQNLAWLAGVEKWHAVKDFDWRG